MDSDILQRQVDALAMAYGRKLVQKWERLRVLWDDACRSPEPEAVFEVLRFVHSLGGSAGTYGFHSVTAAARNLERELEALVDVPDACSTSGLVSRAPLLDTLGQAMLDCASASSISDKR